jgi:serine protease Do
LPCQTAIIHYSSPSMLNRWFCWVTLVLCGSYVAEAEVIQLKDNAVITGKVLAEKPDQVAVDVGYTVLVVPRSEIISIQRETAETKNTVPAESEASSSGQARIYATAGNRVSAASVRDLVNTLGEAVVQVRTPGGIGSGFIINEEGFLITNFHVIEGETEIAVEVYHQNGQLEPKGYRQVRIVAMNKFVDLALLKIEDRTAPKFKRVTLGRSDMLAVGERVFAIGSPLGLERTVTEGILSTKTRQLAGELYLQTTAQINPGNSGGPLFSLTGEVIGVTNMKVAYGEGLGFAIPVEAVKFFLDHRDAFAYSNENPGNAYRYLEPPRRTRHAPTTIE